MLYEFGKIPSESLKKEITRIKRTGRNIISNYYFQNFENRATYTVVSENSIVFYYYDTNFKRVYFYSVDPDELAEILNSIKGKCVIDYISNSEDIKLSQILENCCYRKIACYIKVKNTSIQDQMKRSHIQLLRKICSQYKVEFATEDDLDTLYSCIYKNFNIYTDHLPSYELLSQHIANGQALVIKKQDQISGYIVFQVTGVWSHFNYYYCKNSDEPAMSIALLLAYYDLLGEKNINCVFGWVREENSEMLGIHSRFNYIHSDTKDYIYLRGE